MRVGILGPTGDVAGPVDIGGPRAHALPIRLAVEPGRVVGTYQLIDALRGDGPPADKRAALQSLVSRLRRTLPDPAPLASAG